MSQSDRELASTFVPADIEAPLYEKWMKAGYFTADANSNKEPFTMVPWNFARFSDQAF